MFEKLQNLTQAELQKRRQELSDESEQIEKEVREYERKLKKGLIWYIICIPLIGIVFYNFHLEARRRKNSDLMTQITARKYKKAQIDLELMKLKTLMIGENN